MIRWPSIIAVRLQESPGGRRLASSAVVSLILHVTIVMACAFWLLPRPATPRAEVDTMWSDEGIPELLDSIPLSFMQELETVGGASDGAAVFEFVKGEEQLDRMADLDEVSALDWHAAELPNPAALTDAVSLSADKGRGVRGRRGRGEGGGTAAGNGEGSSSFFGSVVEGERVVYVVDASRSMNHPHPGRMVTRFGRVKLELIRSIGAMTPEQEFFIVYFNDRAMPMPSNSLVTATPSAQQKFASWAAEFPADGSTNPEQALALALNLRPDVIYFLTDGRFPAKIVKEVTQANRSRVVIHTIGFADDEGEELLRAIAAQNSGDYRFIAAEDDGT